MTVDRGCPLTGIVVIAVGRGLLSSSAIHSLRQWVENLQARGDQAAGCCKVTQRYDKQRPSNCTEPV